MYTINVYVFIPYRNMFYRSRLCRATRNAERRDQRQPDHCFLTAFEPAYNARLNLGGKSWCAAEKSKSEYLQVDLGEVYIFVVINEVVVFST